VVGGQVSEPRLQVEWARAPYDEPVLARNGRGGLLGARAGRFEGARWRRPPAIKKPRRVVVMGTPLRAQYYTTAFAVPPSGARAAYNLARWTNAHSPRRGGIRAPAVRVAYRLLGNRADAEDAVQKGLAEGLRSAEILCAAVGGVHVALSRAHERLYRRAAPAPTHAAEPLPRGRPGSAVERLDLTRRAGDRSPRGARAAGAPLRERSRLPGARNDQRNFRQTRSRASSHGVRQS